MRRGQEGQVEFRLDTMQDFYTQTGVLARVLRNDVPIGMIRLNNEEEYKWLKRRMEGDFDLEQEETRDERHNFVPKVRGEGEGGT